MKLAHFAVFLFTVLNTLSFCAQPNTINYQLLELNETITNSEQVIRLQRLDTLNNPNFFVVKNDDEHNGYSFIRKEKSAWNRYALPIEGPKTSVSKVYMLSEDILAVEVLSYYNGTVMGGYAETVFINVHTLYYFDLVSYYSEEHVDLGTGEPKFLFECATTFSINEDTFRITGMNPDRPDRDYCLPSAEYKMYKTIMVQTKFMAEVTNNLYPIRCLDSVCTGIDTIALQAKLPYAQFKQVPLYEYGFDSDELGMEVWQDNKVLFFAPVPMGQVTALCAVNPGYNIHGLTTAMTIAQVLKKYPGNKLRRDLISDWEYLYLKDEDLRIVFRTDETKRIGVYGQDPESESTTIIRPKAKVDFIELN